MHQSQAQGVCVLVSVGAHHDGVEQAAAADGRDCGGADGLEAGAEELAHLRGMIGQAFVTEDLKERGGRKEA
eukprot:scaffold2229_cov113-Isochrysis_galbana.AAC.4